MCIFVIIMEEKPQNIIFTNNIAEQIVSFCTEHVQEIDLYFQQLYSSKKDRLYFSCSTSYYFHEKLFTDNIQPTRFNFYHKNTKVKPIT